MHKQPGGWQFTNLMGHFQPEKSTKGRVMMRTKNGIHFCPVNILESLCYILLTCTLIVCYISLIYGLQL